MGERRSDGFTIIETTLFMAISGLLVLLMIAGAGASINVQRYKDSTETFKSLVQQQYSNLTNVQNGRSSSSSVGCAPDASISEEYSQARGQGSCYLMGKFMYLNKKNVTIYDVTGAASTTDTYGLSDIAALKAYSLNVSSVEVDQKSLEWGVSVKSFPASGTPVSSKLGILFVRAPDSGNIYTFSTTSVPDNPDNIVPNTLKNILATTSSVASARGDRYICVNPEGLITAGGAVSAIYISSNASSASSVEVRTNDMMKLIQKEATGLETGAPQC